jgi:hypothetical protein
MTDLTATAAVEAMRNGDMKTEDYAKALLDRAQALANLNAFRTLNEGKSHTSNTNLHVRIRKPYLALRPVWSYCPR